MKTKIIIIGSLLVTFGGFFAYNALPSDPGSPHTTFSYSVRTPPVSGEPDAGNVSSDFPARIGQLKTYLAQNPEDTTHLLRLARMYHDGHSPDSAAVYYQRILELYPGNRQVWLDLANCFAESMKWQEALNSTRAMLERFPFDGEGLYNLGAIHANMGNYEKAVETWTRLLDDHYESGIRQLAAQSIEKINATGP